MLLAVACAAAAILGGCSSGGDEAASSSTTAAPPTTAADSASEGSTEPDDRGAVLQAQADADRAGEPIVEDGAMEVPGLDGGTATYRIRDLRVTAPTEATDCPGGAPVNAQRLVATMTATLSPASGEDPNVIPAEGPLPVPYVAQLPEIVLVGVGSEDVANDRWFAGISPQSRAMRSMPNTFLRPAPAGPATDCAIAGWEPTDMAEPLDSTEMTVLTSAFIPADFDPADYQFRIGRGDDAAYCWPLDKLSTPAELGQCR
jgi:hypothetical protein